MLSHFPVRCVIDAYLLAVELYKYAFPGQMVGDGVMAPHDTYCRLLVGLTLQQVETAKVSGKVEHALNVSPEGFLLVSGGYAATLAVDVVADAFEPALCILYGIEINACGKGTSTHIVNTALHVSLLPSSPGIAEAPVEAIEGVHAKEGLRRLLVVRLEYDSHLHVVIYHSMRDSVHIMEEIAMGLHEGKIVLMTEQVGPSALAMTEGKDCHGKGDRLAVYAQLYLTPVKLTLLPWLIVLFYKDILLLLRLLLFALLYVLAHT